jgi:hypothetical protein
MKLEWEQSPAGDYHASDPLFFTLYRVKEIKPFGPYEVYGHAMDRIETETLEDAFAAAQADFEARLAKCPRAEHAILLREVRKLIPETIAALKATGVNVSLASDWAKIETGMTTSSVNPIPAATDADQYEKRSGEIETIEIIEGEKAGRFSRIEILRRAPKPPGYTD